MKRLPISAALILLSAGIWYGSDRRETEWNDKHGQIPTRQSHLAATGQTDGISDRSDSSSGSSKIARGLRKTPSPTTNPQGSRGIPITADFVKNLVDGPRNVSFALPDGRTAVGVVEQRHHAADGSPAGVSGRLDAPKPGTFHFRVQPAGAATGPVVGAVVIDDAEIAFRVLPGADDPSVLAALPVDQVICRRYTPPPEIIGPPQEIPADHPTDIPYPSYQNGVIPLQSRPDAVAVIYLDFDGQAGPHEGWRDAEDNDFDALPPQGMTPSLIKEIWAGVSEDFAPFNINVTTDLQVFLDAPETSRQRCIITPTTTAHPGAGGVAYVGSFAWSGDTPCWCFYFSNAKNATEIISHEIGHTLGLFHDGRLLPVEEYYFGHGSFSNGWAPIMGVGYYRNLSQWSKGEYLSANESQDDIAVIAANPNVGIVNDDAGDDHGGAAVLEVFADGSVDSQGNIGTQADVDAFRFTTTGGSVSLTITSVPTSADLDVLASLHDASGLVISQNDPDTSLNATLTTNIPAGEYTVRIDGTGRGDPLALGYTDYGSLGQYTITGAINGAVGPDRFTVVENSPPGSSVGTPSPRVAHGESPLTYAISSGNDDSTFAIDPATGAITVANAVALDFEALSPGWDQPSNFELTVTISDSVNPALDESLRVVVQVTDVNEAPSLSGGTSILAISHTVNGVTLGTIAATDPDRFDFATVQITAGDPSGTFSLTPAGLLTLTGVLDASVQPIYHLTVRATDQGAPAITREETVTVTVIPAAPQFTPGLAYQTIYGDIDGPDVADLTSNGDFPTRPTSEVGLAGFSTTARAGSYGSTVRAWLIAPATGNYQFWIAGDESAELFLSVDGNPANMTGVCTAGSSTKRYEWTKYASQQSATYSLTAGQVCYVEARHKEQFGEDHLAVAWEIKDPDNTDTLVPRQVIPGRYLSPHSLNYSPSVPASTADLYRNSYPGYQVTTAFANDPNPADTLSWAITAGNESGAFAIDPNTGEVTVADAGSLNSITTSPVVLTLTVTDNGTDPLSDSGLLTIHLLGPLIPPTAGLVQEFWDEIPGAALADLYASPRFPERPDRLGDLNAIDFETTLESDFGARIRAYFIPPSSSSYTFSIAFEGAGSLFLSSDTNPVNAIEIASADGSQASLPVPLSAGQRYFIEARVKHGTGSSQLTASWSRTDAPEVHIIGDDVTEPYDSNVAPAFMVPSYSFNLPENFSLGTTAGTVNATDSPFEAIRYAIVSGDPLHAFEIHPKTGMIRVANPANLVIGSVYQLQVGAQDSGHGRHFAPRAALVPVTITLPNDPPEFIVSPIALGPFPATLPVSQSLTPFVTDPEDPIGFALVSGPSWVSLTSVGMLSGTPGYNDFGSHLLTVSANDGRGHIVQGTVSFTVSASPDVPASILTTLDAVGEAITGTHDPGTAGSAAVSDNLYETLAETLPSDTSLLEYRWTFPSAPGRPAVLKVEAHHSANTEDDDFQFSVSTDGGNTFTDAFLVSDTTDNDTLKQFSFTAGGEGSTVIKVVDTNRTAGNSNLDTLFIDLLTVTLAANSVPATNNAIFQVAPHAPVGVAIGSAAATDSDPGQTLTYTIPRGNEAGQFSITPAGTLTVAADIPPEAGPFSMIVVSTDSGVPALANYATITIDVVPPISASLAFQNLTPTYDGSPQPVIVTTSPANLPTTVTYAGSSTPPTNAGTYTVTASVFDPIHTGSASDTLVIEKAPAIATITGLSQLYDGSQKSVTVTTSPPGRDYTLTYHGTSSAPTAVGDYTVVATITDPNYSGTSTRTFSITNNLTVDSGQTFIVPETTIPYQSLLNAGTIIVSTNPLQISGNANNTGILRLYGDAVLDIAGSFANSGVIDIINWNGTLPPGLINTGTILDRSALRILTTGTSETQFTLGIPGFPGHLYQLETSSLSDPWSPLGPPVAGTGDALNPPLLQFTPDLDGPARFYRIAVAPAP